MYRYDNSSFQGCAMLNAYPHSVSHAVSCIHLLFLPNQPSGPRLRPDNAFPSHVEPAATLHNETIATSGPVLPLMPTPPDHTLFAALSGTSYQASSLDTSVWPEVVDLDIQTEQFLIQTYFEMAHSQYPFLLKHQFLKWIDNWRNDRTSLPLEMRWKAFIVYMVS